MKKHVVWWIRVLLILIMLISTLSVQASTRTSSDISSRAGITFQKSSDQENTHFSEGEESSSNNEEYSNSRNKLPQTGEEKSNNLVFLGISLLLLMSVWLLINRKRNEREK